MRGANLRGSGAWVHCYGLQLHFSLIIGKDRQCSTHTSKKEIVSIIGIGSGFLSENFPRGGETRVR